MQRSLTTSRMQSSCWVNYDRPVSMTLFAAAAGPAQHSNHLPRSNGRPSSCNDVVGSHRGVFATSTRPRRMHSAKEEASSVFRGTDFALRTRPAIVGGSPCKRRERLAPPVIPTDTPIPVRMAEVAIPG